MPDEFDKLAEKIGVVVQGGSVSIGSVNVYKSPPALPVGIPQNLPYSGAVEFVGRLNELENLHQQLQQTDRVVISAVSGMGGVGKTELALQYALQHIEDYVGGVCWLRARTENLGIQILEFAQLHLSLEIPQELQGEILELNQKIKWCWQHWQPDGAVLLILDDITSLANCREILQEIPKRFHVLITTRQRKLDASFSELSLDVLSLEASLELLVTLVGKTRIEHERQIAENLCEWLGYLPLGLELVGRYLAEDPDLSLAEMLERLDAQRLKDEALDLNEQQAKEKYMMTAQRGVKAAFELTWLELVKQNFTTAQLLKRINPIGKLFKRESLKASDVAMLLGIFAPDSISWELVETVSQSLQWSKDELVEAKKRLYKLHLIQQTSEGHYRIHPLIREFLHEKLAKAQNSKVLKKEFAKSMAKVAQTIPDLLTYEIITRVTSLIPHLRELATKMPDYLENKDLIWPFTALARFYSGQGFYELATPWYKDCVSITQSRLGLYHPDVATSVSNLGTHYYKELRRYEEAEKLEKQALEIRQRLFGDRHPQIAASLSGLAAVYSFQDRFEEAEELNKQALELRISLLGKNHPDVAESLNNLASVYVLQRRYEEAEYCLLAALEQWRQLFGNHHHHVATCLGNIAIFYEEQNLYAEAESFHLQALEIYKFIYGNNHLDVARKLSEIARFHWENGIVDKAETYWLEALKIQRGQLGERHPGIAATLANLATVYVEQQRFSEAESDFQSALQIWDINLPENFNDVSSCFVNLAKSYEVQNRYSEAEATYRKIIELARNAFGNESLQLAEQLLVFADSLEVHKQYVEAESYYKQALQMAEVNLGSNNPKLTPFINNLGIYHYKQRKYAEAESLYKQVLEINRQSFGLEHEDVGLSLHNLAALYDDQNKLDEAVAFCIQAQQIWGKTIGVEDPLYARSLNRLAEIYKRQNKLIEARSLYQKALAVREKRLGVEHPDTQSTRQSLEEISKL